MDPIIPTQASEAAFNISDYANFDFDFEAPHLAQDTKPQDSATATPLGMAIEEFNVGIPQLADADSDRVFNLSGDSETLGYGFDVTQAAEEAYDGASDFPSCRPSYTSGPEHMSSDSNVLTTPFGDPDLTDSFQTMANFENLPYNFTALEPTAFTGGVDRTGLNRWDPSLAQAGTPMHTSPSFQVELSTSVNLIGENLLDLSRWVPASAEQQQCLNTLYAPQLSQLVTDPNPPPFLFFPTQEPSAVFTPSHYPQLIDDRTGNHGSRIPDPAAWTPSRGLSLLLQGRTEVLPPQVLTPGAERLIHQDTDSDVPKATNSSNKRASDAEDSESEPEPKRHNIFEAEESNSATAENTSLASKMIPRKGSHWRYELKSETRARNQRRDNCYRRRTNTSHAKGKAAKSKMQKMLDEIADTKEFAEAQGYEVEQSEMRRPVRKGAQKSYVGQE